MIKHIDIIDIGVSEQLIRSYIVQKGKTTHESVKTKLLGIVSILVLSMIGIGGSSIFMISSAVKKNEELKDKMEFQKEMK